MNKLKSFVIIVISVVGLSTLVPITQTAQAATWHKGTPKVLRGKWRVKHVSTSTERLQITKSRVYLYSAGSFNLKNVKYKKTGAHSYKVRGYEYTYLNSNSTITFRTKGTHTIQYKGNYPGASWINYIHR